MNEQELEWRRIPEFPLYELSSQGDIRNRDTGKILPEIENKITGAWFYSLWRNGHNYSRSWKPLVHQIFPEIYLKGWLPLPGWEGYYVNEKAEVLGKNYEKLPLQKGCYRLYKDGKVSRVHPIDFDMSAFPDFKPKKIVDRRKKGRSPDWKVIPGAPNYRLNRDGRVTHRNNMRSIQTRTYPKVNGSYDMSTPYVTLRVSGEMKSFNVNNLMAELWPETLVEKEAA